MHYKLLVRKQSNRKSFIYQKVLIIRHYCNHVFNILVGTAERKTVRFLIIRLQILSIAEDNG